MAGSVSLAKKLKNTKQLGRMGEALQQQQDSS